MKIKATLSDSFLKGYARVFSIFQSNEYPDLSNGWNKDYQALRGDWAVVGKSIEEATKQYAGTVSSKK